MVKKHAEQAIQISSVKPFRLINLPFYFVNQIYREVGDG